MRREQQKVKNDILPYTLFQSTPPKLVASSKNTTSVTQSLDNRSIPTATVSHQIPASNKPRVTAAQPAPSNQHRPMHPLPKQTPPPTPTETPSSTPLQTQKEPTEPSEWTIDETISNISYMDPSLAVHVEAFRSHEIDGMFFLILVL